MRPLHLSRNDEIHINGMLFRVVGNISGANLVHLQSGTPRQGSLHTLEIVAAQSSDGLDLKKSLADKKSLRKANSP